MPIETLCDCPELFPQVARWIWEEWRHLLTHATLAEFEQWFRLAARGAGMPTTLVWLEEKQLVGTVSLECDDMEIRPDLTPWLASLYVAPSHRGRGIGRALVGLAEEAARQRGVDELYLYTPGRDAFYAALGWEVVERCAYRGQPVTVMRRRLRGDAPQA